MNLEATQTSQSPSRTGYSPAISAQLQTDGQKFKLAAICDEYVVVREARAVPAGLATIFLQVDDRKSTLHIHLTRGIDPSQDEQPYTVASGT
jgi:hypothetical protein